jgi:hypothetical protein
MAHWEKRLAVANLLAEGPSRSWRRWSRLHVAVLPVARGSNVGFVSL